VAVANQFLIESYTTQQEAYAKQSAVTQPSVVFALNADLSLNLLEAA
jgi:hypothetical protein